MKSEFIIGKNYEVPCAQITLKEDGRVYYLPVIDLPHSDPAFDFRTVITISTGVSRSIRG